MKRVPWHWTWLDSGRVQVMYRDRERNRTPEPAGEPVSQAVNETRTIPPRRKPVPRGVQGELI